MLSTSIQLRTSLTGFTEDALSQSTSVVARAAFKKSPTLATEIKQEDARLIFASEAAFAAVAAIALEDTRYLGSLAPNFRSIFPHIYDSPLFAWYTPQKELREHAQEVLAQASSQAQAQAQAPLNLLSSLYEQSIPTTVRKHFSQFYTSAPVVTLMLNNAGFVGPKILDAKLIDPAAGAGAFLIEATRRILLAADTNKLSPAETCVAVQRIIHGLDINPLGILLTEAAIALLLAPYLLAAGEGTHLQPLHLHVTDTLTIETGTNAVDALDDVNAIKNRSGVYEDGFTHVIANPPYAKYPSRLLSATQKQRFAATTFGHPNLYGLFLQIGVDLLADKGRLAFITPKSFVSGLYFRRLRQFLTQQLNLESFDTFDKRTGLFTDVLQEVVILSASKRAQSRSIRLREYGDTSTQKPNKDIVVASTSVLLDAAFDYAFFVAPQLLAHRVLTQMTVRSRPLSTCGFKAVTGTVVWNRLRANIRDHASEDVLPLIWSNSVRMFLFTGLGNRAGVSTHCALTKKTANIVAYGDGILVKRMTSREEPRRLVACRIPAALANAERGYFVENHVNIIRARTSGLDLDAILGLLNSRLFDYVFRALNGNTNVSSSELELLPVASGPEVAEIAELARALTAVGGEDARLLGALDAAVYRLYAIPAADISELEAQSN